jgi:hypothetical protein
MYAKLFTFVAITIFVSAFPTFGWAGKASEAIEALNEARKADIFKALVISSGEKCEKVIRVFFKGDNESDDSAYYAVRCSGKTDWVVSVKNSGGMSSRVTSCAFMKLVGVSCWNPI